MTEPDDSAEPESPPTVLVPARCDLFGQPVDLVEANPAAAGQWDERLWSDRPPS
jgi:hypothetical protein